MIVVAPNRLMNPMSPGLIIPGNYNIVQYNGTNQYLKKSTNFGSDLQYAYTGSFWINVNVQTMTAGSKTVFASGCWLNGNGDTPWAIQLFITPQSTTSGAKFRIGASGQNNNGDYFGFTFTTCWSVLTGFLYDPGVWHHIMIGFSADAYAHMVVNGTDLYSGLITPDPCSFYNDTENTSVSAITYPGAGAYFQHFPGKIALPWFSVDYELNPANTTDLRRFLNADGTPANLDSNGAIPGLGGLAPQIYLPNPVATVQNNAGSAGNFTKVGTPTGSTGTLKVLQP